MNNRLLDTLIKHKTVVARLLKDRVLPTMRNFLPLTYDMKEALFGSIAGGDDMCVYLPIDTSHMRVISILEEEERIIREGGKGSLKVVTQQEHDDMLIATLLLTLLVYDKKLETDEEKIETILSEYPELRDWIQND